MAYMTVMQQRVSQDKHTKRLVRQHEQAHGHAKVRYAHAFLWKPHLFIRPSAPCTPLRYDIKPPTQGYLCISTNPRNRRALIALPMSAPCDSCGSRTRRAGAPWPLSAA